MGNVYSIRMYTAASLAAGTFAAGTPPTGTVWVVRDIRVHNHQATPVFALQGLGGVKLQLNTGAILWRTPFLYTQTGTTYSSELRTVLNVGDHLNVITLEAGWDVTISGFQLTTP